MNCKEVIRMKNKNDVKNKILSFNDEVKYYDYYNQFLECNINLLKMELAKANVEKENIENELKYKNKSLIKVVSAVSTLLLSVAALFKGNEKKTVMLIVVVAIILILIYYVIHDALIDKNRNINLKKISNLSLKIQIVENLIAEKEKENN